MNPGRIMSRSPHGACYSKCAGHNAEHCRLFDSGVIIVNPHHDVVLRCAVADIPFPVFHRFVLHMLCFVKETRN